MHTAFCACTHWTNRESAHSIQTHLGVNSTQPPACKGRHQWQTQGQATEMPPTLLLLPPPSGPLIWVLLILLLFLHHCFQRGFKGSSGIGQSELTGQAKPAFSLCLPLSRSLSLSLFLPLSLSVVCMSAPHPLLCLSVTGMACREKLQWWSPDAGDRGWLTAKLHNVPCLSDRDGQHLDKPRETDKTRQENMFTECCKEGVKRPPSGHYSFRQILFFQKYKMPLMEREKKILWWGNPQVYLQSGVQYVRNLLMFILVFFIYCHRRDVILYILLPHTSQLQPCLWIHVDNGGVGMKYCIMEIPVNLCDVCSRHERPEIHGYHGERLAHCQVRKSMAKAFFSCVILLDRFCTRDTRMIDTWQRELGYECIKVCKHGRLSSWEMRLGRQFVLANKFRLASVCSPPKSIWMRLL